MKEIILLILMMAFTTSSFPQQKTARKTYKYKQYEKVYLNELSTKLGDGGLSDLSLDTNLNVEFANKLPSRSNFKPEVIRSIRRIK